MNNASAMSPSTLAGLLGTPRAPRLLDVRRREVFEGARRMIPGARWRDPAGLDEWKGEVAPGEEWLVYCVHGHNVSDMVASALRVRGVRARVLAGGIEAWRQAGGATVTRTALPGGGESGPTRWVTRERPKIDRLACPWLIRRFVDPQAEIHYVATDSVRAVAEEIGGVPFDIPAVEFSHVGERCSFDAFLDRLGLVEPALARLAVIVRAADTARPDLAQEAAGLLAVSLGISALHADDLAALDAAMTVYDALYAWCRHAAGETHDWRPESSAEVAA